MKKIVYSLWSIVYGLFFLSTLYSLLSTFDTEAAEPVSLNELLENAQKYDEKVVTFEGEVIGDIMIRQGAAWINVLDKTGAIGVFCPKELTDDIEHTGSYKFKGDTVSVRGVFHSSCPEHGGDTDIHAEKLTVAQKGEELHYSLDPQRVKAAIFSASTAFVLVLVYLVVRRFR